MVSLPDHVRRPGDIVGAAPYRAEGCLMQAIVLEGDKKAQQRHIDLVLNQPAGGAFVFHVLSDLVLLSALYVETMRSLDPIDAQRGVMGEMDVGFWTAVHGGPVARPDQWTTYWFPSFLYVDTASAMSSGREIYGYPKTASRIVRGSNDPADPTVEIEALHMPLYGPTERPVEECVLKIAKPSPVVEGEKDDELDLAALWKAIRLPAQFWKGKIVPPSPPAMPQIMLRQFRDPFVLGRSTTQEGLVAAPRSLDVTGLGFLHGGTMLDLTVSASHPIADTLGVAPTSRVRGFWLKQDFELGAARQLWRRP